MCKKCGQDDLTLTGTNGKCKQTFFDVAKKVVDAEL